jgi:membrane associated rhomboid family serine protease
VATCYRHPDRETGLSCSECGRPICTECMTMAAVGIRCPEHAGTAGPKPAQRVRRGVRRTVATTDDPIVVKALIVLNVLVFLVTLAQSGSSLGRIGGQLLIDGAIISPAIADGEWWRLLTAAFLHGSVLHVGMNMLMLWWIGAPMELALGRARFLALYVVSALAGSAGALLLNPEQITVGASGAIFGTLGAALVFERQRHYVLGGSALTIVVLNLVLTFAVPHVSIGGHVGGLAGGALAGLALTRFGRAHPLYGAARFADAAGLAAVAIASIALAYWRVQPYA